jgi:hypothetical protein
MLKFSDQLVPQSWLDLGGALVMQSLWGSRVVFPFQKALPSCGIGNSRVEWAVGEGKKAAKKMACGVTWLWQRLFLAFTSSVLKSSRGLVVKLPYLRTPRGPLNCNNGCRESKVVCVLGLRCGIKQGLSLLCGGDNFLVAEHQKYRINCFISYVPNISYSLIYHTLPIGSKPLQGLYIRLYASSVGWFSPFLRDILNLASAECLKCLKFKGLLLHLYHSFILYHTVLNQLKLPFKVISSYDIKQLIRYWIEHCTTTFLVYIWFPLFFVYTLLLNKSRRL